MAEATEDVKEVAQTPDVQPETGNSAEVSEDVKTPEAKVDRKVYEQVRESMKQERSERKAKEQKIADLEARLAELENRTETPLYEPDTEEDVRTKAKVDVLYLVQTDPFVKENLELIEEKMEENPKLTAREAVKEIKATFFDKMQKEIARVEPEVPPKQLNPKGSTTDKKETLDDAFENADVGQLEAYKRALARLK